MLRMVAVVTVVMVAIILILPQIDLEPTVLRFEQIVCALRITLALVFAATTAFFAIWTGLTQSYPSYVALRYWVPSTNILRC
jgi:Mn2+/Fe2+ NRAMP family transporter